MCVQIRVARTARGVLGRVGRAGKGVGSWERGKRGILGMGVAVKVLEASIILSSVMYWT